MESLIYEPANPGNLGTIIRSAAALGVNRIHVYDAQGLLERGTKNLREVKRASMGALSLIEVVAIEDSKGLQRFFSEYPYRKIATVCNGENSVDLPSFIYQATDLVLFGNERNGLPMEITERKDVQRLRIPMQRTLNSLNISCAFAIIAYEYMRQFE